MTNTRRNKVDDFLYGLYGSIKNVNNILLIKMMREEEEEEEEEEDEERRTFPP